MTNNSLITKYRPKTFDEVIGHKNIVTSLKQSLDMDLAHSFIFCGPPGTGKTTLARIIASEVGCKFPIEVDGASATGIDAMRDITSTLGYASLTGQAKVVIVDEAHKLSEAAKTSLLKSIEEPGSNVYWVLATTELSKISKAIQTRCQVYTLNGLPDKDIINLLSRVCESEGFEPPEEVLEVILESAGGSARLALSLLSVCWNSKTEQEARALLSSVEAEEGNAVDLARYLVKNTTYNWSSMQVHVTNLKDENPESIRLVILSYISKVLMNTKNGSEAARLASLLSAFSKPYYISGEKFAPLLLSLAEIAFSE